jgi:hypothetical protein
VELDDERNGGKTQFSSGDTVFFKAYTSPPDMEVTGDASSGTLTKGAKGTGIVKEQLTFANAKTANLRYLANKITSFKWFGRDGGAPSVIGNQVTIPANTIGVLEVEYEADYTSWSLGGVTIPSGLAQFPVLVVLVGANV